MQSQINEALRKRVEVVGCNQNHRQITEGLLRCGSKRHIGDRMRPLEEFCKSKTPDGYSYSCKSCRTKENKELCSIRYQRWKMKDPAKALYQGRKSDAKKRGIEFTLTIEDVVIPETCPILGIPIVADIGPRTNNSPSIDRIDNTKGYTPDNFVIISWRANLLKKDATLDELRKIADYYTLLEENKNG